MAAWTARNPVDPGGIYVGQQAIFKSSIVLSKIRDLAGLHSFSDCMHFTVCKIYKIGPVMKFIKLG